MINTFQNKTSDRYWFKDYQEITKKQHSTSSLTHSLCTDCYDYYEVPPCQTNSTTNSGCFPSLISPDRN